MQNILIIGPQGSGKGTQSDLLAAKLGIPHLSLGTMFRAEVASGSALGKEAASYMERGEIVPREIAGKVMTERLSRPDAAQGVILDGYPRTAGQAEELDGIMTSLGRTITHVVLLHVSDEAAIQRIAGRRICADPSCERIYHVTSMPPKGDPDHCDACGGPLMQRKDDVPDAIRRRLEIYRTETVPLIALYRDRGLLREIDGELPIAEVQDRLLALMQ